MAGREGSGGKGEATECEAEAARVVKPKTEAEEAKCKAEAAWREFGKACGMDGH